MWEWGSVMNLGYWILILSVHLLLVRVTRECLLMTTGCRLNWFYGRVINPGSVVNGDVPAG